MSLKKTYVIKIWNNDESEYLGTVEADITSFQMAINGGLGEMSIALPFSFNNFKQGGIVELNNVYKIYCVDQDTDQDGVLIYSGFVNHWESGMEAQSKVRVNLSGFWTRMARTVLKSVQIIELKTKAATGLGTGGVSEAVEIADVVTAILTRFNAETVFNEVAAGTISNTGEVMTYTYLNSVYFDAVKICREFAPANWWFFIGADNLLDFKTKPATATHEFTYGKDIKRINVKFSMDGIVNRYMISDNDALQKLYSDTDSSDKYGDIWQTDSDERIESEPTMDLKGASLIAERKDANVVLIFDIYDNNYNEHGYDIESILPGHTCSILGLDENKQVELSDNMLIKSVKYTKAYVTIEVQTPREDVAEILRGLQDKTSKIEKDSYLTAYTT